MQGNKRYLDILPGFINIVSGDIHMNEHLTVQLWKFKFIYAYIYVDMVIKLASAHIC